MSGRERDTHRKNEGRRRYKCQRERERERERERVENIGFRTPPSLYRDVNL